MAQTESGGTPKQEEATRSLAERYSLSDEEAAERVGAQPEIMALLQEARLAFPETFGGLYVDHASGSEVHLRFTRNANDAVATLQDRFQQLDLLPEYAASSEQELIATLSQARSIRDAASRLQPSLGDVDLAVDIRNNAIKVNLERDTAAARALLTDLLDTRTRFETGVSEPQCSRSDCFYMMGGLRVAGNGYYCSTGFNVLFYGASDTPTGRGVLTAGHCGGVGTQWSHGGDPLGIVSHSRFTGNIDAAVINYTTTTPKIEGYSHIFDEARDATENPLHVADILSSFEYYTGQQVCKSGISTLVTCGIVENPKVSVNYLPGSTDIVQADYCSVSGDSGAAVWDPSYGESRIRAAGIHSGGYLGSSCSDPSSYSLFTPIEFVVNAFDLQVRNRYHRD